jgi:superfamily II DNA or RNA helicase
MATVKEALQAINNRCDGAVAKDGQGFNGRDSYFCKAILEKDYWTHKMELAAHKTLKKYSGQLTACGISYENLVFETTEKKEPERRMDLDFDPVDLVFTIASSYSEKETIQAIQAPGRRWNADKKVWTFGLSKQFMAWSMEHKGLYTDISPTARDQLNTLWKQSKKEAKNTDPEDPTTQGSQDLSNVKSNVKSYIKSEFYPHQVKPFHELITHDQYALFPEQRVGKTYPMIGAIGYYADTKKVSKVLVVAPKTVMYEWKEKLDSEADYGHEALILEDSLESRREALEILKSPDKLTVVIINYQALGRLQGSIKAWKPEMVILDEAHHIKNGKSQQSKAAAAIGKEAKYRYILTGTPISQGPLDIWAQYRFLDDSIFGRSFVRFRDKYVVMGGYMNKQVIGLKTIPTIMDKPNPWYDQSLSEEFTEKIYSRAIRMTLKEVHDSEEDIVDYIAVDLEMKAREIYNKMLKDSVLEISRGKITVTLAITKLLRLQQICGGFLTVTNENEDMDMGVTQVSKAKLRALQEVLKGLDGKAVVFCKFVPEVLAIDALCTKLGIQHHTLYGKTKNRAEIKKDFQENPDTKIFISQIGTGGEGITLSAADTSIFYSVGPSLLEFEQAKSRIRNLNKSHAMKYIYLVANNTRDVTLLKILNRKQDVSKMSVDKLRQLLVEGEEDNGQTN